MLVAELEQVIERRAPLQLAQPGDNCGLLAGDRRAEVRRVLAALELTPAVLGEAATKNCDTILTHHPLLFSPLRVLTEADPRASLLRRLTREERSLIAAHTNVDAAAGGLADIAAGALGLRDTMPLERARAGWYKLVGFIPPEAVEKVAAAVFAAGAGKIGDYADCAFGCEGLGWFTPGPEAHPSVGKCLEPERTPETRWETVVPRSHLNAVITAFVAAHPYEEPAFDVYPVEDALPRLGLGRVGSLPRSMAAGELAGKVLEVFEVSGVRVVGEGRTVSRVGVLPGSGRGMLEAAFGCCDVLVTGDLGYHDAERAAERGLALVDVPHGEVEWWAFSRWAGSLGEELASAGVELTISEAWGPLWRTMAGKRSAEGKDDPGASGCNPAGRRLRLWIDGGSRGNPGPSALGVVVEDEQGHVLERLKRVLGVGTNNVAEYQALLAALERAESLGAGEVEVFSDSELLVKQLKGEYKVRNDGLRPLHAEALRRAGAFRSFSIRHVSREDNRAADKLVNEALDELEGAGL